MASYYLTYPAGGLQIVQSELVMVNGETIHFT